MYHIKFGDFDAKVKAFLISYQFWMIFPRLRFKISKLCNQTTFQFYENRFRKIGTLFLILEPPKFNITLEKVIPKIAWLYLFDI